MFPSHQFSNDLLYEISEIPQSHNEDFVQQNQNLISGEASVEGNNVTQKMRKGKRLKNLGVANNNDGDDTKKIMRKELERQRRQHMTKLYTELRSLLPVESIKGKRAVSDHMKEAVNYITYLKKRVQQLSDKRDKLQRLSNLSALMNQGSSSTHTATSSDSRSIINSVAIHPYWGGVESVIHSGFEDEKSWHLSTMMQVILDEGLDVVRCVSSQTNEGFLHTIQSEVIDPTQLDLLRLQSKLNDLISY